MKNVIIFLFLVSCADHQYIDSRLSEPYEEFINQSRIREFKVDVSEVSLVIGEINEVGRYSNDLGNKVITVNKSLFSERQPDSLALQYIVFHEFGHFIGRGHCDGYSIMNPNIYAAIYRNSKTERIKLIDELFR
jgi:hypothetical protein